MPGVHARADAGPPAQFPVRAPRRPGDFGGCAIYFIMIGVLPSYIRHHRPPGYTTEPTTYAHKINKTGDGRGGPASRPGVRRRGGGPHQGVSQTAPDAPVLGHHGGQGGWLVVVVIGGVRWGTGHTRASWNLTHVCTRTYTHTYISQHPPMTPPPKKQKQTKKGGRPGAAGAEPPRARACGQLLRGGAPPRPGGEILEGVMLAATCMYCVRCSEPLCVAYSCATHPLLTRTHPQHSSCACAGLRTSTATPSCWRWWPAPSASAPSSSATPRCVRWRLS